MNRLPVILAIILPIILDAQDSATHTHTAENGTDQSILWLIILMIALIAIFLWLRHSTRKKKRLMEEKRRLFMEKRREE